MLVPAHLAAQSTYLSDFPIWSSSPANQTTSVALGDVDVDGDLDFLCGNHGGNALYENTAGTLSSQNRIFRQCMISCNNN
jgi:hypothetical protein